MARGGFSDYLLSAETGTWCSDDPDVKLSIEYCPTDDQGVPQYAEATNAVPVGFYTRVVFDELLDPSIEVLEEQDDGTVLGSIDAADPLTVTCDGDEVPYTGWYQPSGSHLTFPPGPGIQVQATEFVGGTGTTCEVSVNDSVTDKDGNNVASAGPWTFVLAQLHVAGFQPAPDSADVNPAANMVAAFNAPLNPDTVGEAEITLHEIDATRADSGAIIEAGYDPTDMDDSNDDPTPAGAEIAEIPVTATVATDAPTTIVIDPDQNLKEDGTFYRLRVVAEGLEDSEGGISTVTEEAVTRFQTGALMLPDGGMAPDGGAQDGGTGDGGL